MSDIRLIYITCESREQALELGRLLVEERLAACANVLGPMTSIYRWEGTIETTDEAVLIAKTTTENVAALTGHIKATHSYSVPCVLSIPIQAEEGNADYLTWLKEKASPSD